MLFLILPFFASGQSSTPTDSTALVAIPRWIHWKAIHDIKVGRSCDSLRLRLAEEIDTLRQAKEKDQAVIDAQAQELKLEIESGRLLNLQRGNAEERARLAGQEVKRIRTVDYIAAGGAVVAAALGAPVWLVAVIASVPAGRHLAKK